MRKSGGNRKTGTPNRLKASFSTTARASCNRKIPATIKNHLSPADWMWFRRLRATKVADMNPATPVTTHLKISNGIMERHCNKNQIRELSVDKIMIDGS